MSQRFKLNLQFFAEGAGEGAAPSQATASNEVGTQTAPKVVYGKQVENVEVDDPQPQAQQEGAEGEQKEGEQSSDTLPLKELFNKYPNCKQEVESLIQNRIKNVNSKVAKLEGQLSSHNDLLTILYSRYNVEDGNLQGLQDALSKDLSYLQEEADLRGMDVKQLQYIKNLEAQNMRIQRQQQLAQEQQYIQMQQQKWLQEAEQCKAEFPDFDFMYELNNNPQFESMIRSGVPVLHAYKVAHMKEILEAEKQAAAQQVTNNIKARQTRPVENAAKINTRGVFAKTDPRKLTKQDLAEIRRRVERGEKITF